MNLALFKDEKNTSFISYARNKAIYLISENLITSHKNYIQLLQKKAFSNEHHILSESLVEFACLIKNKT